MKNRVLSLVLVFVTFSVFSQKIIQGKVTAFRDAPLKNVKIQASKSKVIVYTDSLGNFKIPISKRQKLIFTADGFFDYEKKIKSSKHESLNINLIYDENSKTSFSTATNTGHIAKKILEYHLKNSLNKNNKFQNMEDVYDVIQYVYPTAKVFNVEGIDQVLLTTRGDSSLFASRHALLVVDGIITNDISGISPMDVKDVKIHMGNNAAIWGVRGSNGVVEIDLKYGPE